MTCGIPSPARTLQPRLRHSPPISPSLEKFSCCVENNWFSPAMKNKPSNKTCVFTKICLVFTLQNNWVHSCGSQEIAAIGVDYFDKGHALVAVASAKAFLVLSKSSATVRGKWTGHQGDEFQAVPKMKSSPLNQTTSRSMEQVSPLRCSVLLHGFNFATQGLSCKKVGKES